MLVPDASSEVCARHRDAACQEQPWQLVLHAHVDHGIPMEVLERMYLGVSPSGTKTWKLPPASWLFDMWEKSDFYEDAQDQATAAIDAAIGVG